MTQQIDRPVRLVEPIRAKPKQETAEATPLRPVVPPQAAASPYLWIYLTDGASMKVDSVKETDTGAWYSRGNLSIFVERERIARIEADGPGAKSSGWVNRDWTSGNPKIDSLIRINGARFSVDPYLLFCVIEHESQFHVKAVSPKGARGLMQLMPGTATRFGVRRSFDPAENIFGGTQYLKELLQKFDGRLDLVLAGYNAGEGAVLKYGWTVPPYRETREYVRKITRRYGSDKVDSPGKTTAAPR
jgi:soluble lytic murein transglycosylase-like protein